jgi:bla regulator protein blaR1
MTAWLGDTLLYSGALIALVLLVRRPLGRYFGPQFAYALWALPALRLLLPPIELPASLAPAVSVAAAPIALQPAEPASAFMLAAEPTASVPAFDWSTVALCVWLGGALAFLAWRIVTYRWMRQDLLRDARPVGEVPGSKSGAGGRIRLVETPAVTSPVAFGLRDKVVALPPAFMAMEDRAARDLAIAHELAHHRGHDIAANFAAQPLLALHWFNPLAWMGWRAMRRDQEAACDARVLAGRDRGERALYAGLIANFAAGPRLALAAPMACPIIGEKSIIHRLRSLTMTDVSPSRRRLGRWLLAGGALALPLTASISYAAAAQERVVQSVDVDQSDVPPVPPEAPQAHEAPRIERHVYKIHRDADDAHQGEHRMIVMRTDGPISEAQRKHIEEMSREWAKKGREWREKAGDWQKMAREQRQFALAHVPEVSTDCDKAGGSGSRSWTDDSGRQHVVICERIIRQHAEMAQGQASMGLRMAREAIAHNDEISASVRDQVLAELDQEIERIEHDGG